MRFEQEITSVEGLIALLGAQFAAEERVWFRGQRKASWDLQPSLVRGLDPTKRVQAEALYIKTFKQNALAYTPHPPATEWAWLFLMQHYRAPTRLLDWSESPLVGLYFASEQGPTDDEEHGALWCLLPRELNARANINMDLEADLPFFEVDDYLDSYLPSNVAKDTVTDLEPVAAGAQRRFSRLFAQLGVFTITHRRKQNIEDGDHVAKIILPLTVKAHIRRQLALLGITRLSLFPELESVGILTRGVQI